MSRGFAEHGGNSLKINGNQLQHKRNMRAGAFALSVIFITLILQ
jgi:hypothetical protein